jgi:ABC-type nitrate/sulfonate/bicarbonate transport system substrate-binding protein
MKKLIYSWVILFVFITIAHSDNIKPDIVRIGYIALLPQLPLIISYENDRLNFKHIQVEPIKFKSFTSIEAAIRVGAIHAAAIPIPIILSIASDMAECKICDINIMGAIQKGGTLFVAKESLSIKDLQGKVIGVPGFDSIETFSLIHIMKNNDFTFGLDYKAIGITFDSALKDLKTDKLQALYLPEPWGSIAEKEENAVSIEDETFSIQQPTTLLVISKEKLTQNPKAIKEWVESVFNACLFIENDIQSGARQTAIIQNKYFNFPNDLVAESLSNRKGRIDFTPFIPDLDYIKSIMTKATEIKLIMKSVEFDKILDTTIMADLIARKKSALPEN